MPRDLSARPAAPRRDAVHNSRISQPDRRSPAAGVGFEAGGLVQQVDFKWLAGDLAPASRSAQRLCTAASEVASFRIFFVSFLGFFRVGMVEKNDDQGFSFNGGRDQRRIV